MKKSKLSLEDVLPEELLVEIVSRLPLKDAVKTSILSKSWVHLWKYIHSVEFDFSCSESNNSMNYMQVQERDARCIESFMHHHKAKIRRFHVSFPVNRGNAERVGLWIRHALSRGVKDLSIKNLKGSSLQIGLQYNRTLPSYMFQSQWLIELRLTRCELHKSLLLWLPFVKTLVLKRLNLSERMVVSINSMFPSLERLSILHCFYGERLVISPEVPYLISLTLAHGGEFEINVPAVTIQLLELQGNYGIPVSSKLDRLKELYLNFGHKGQFRLEVGNALLKMLIEVPSGVHIKLTDYCTQALSSGTDTPKAIKARCLELVLSLRSSVIKLKKITTALSFFPEVEKLILVFKEKDKHNSSNFHISEELPGSQLFLRIKTIEVREYVICETITQDEIKLSCKKKRVLMEQILKKSPYLEELSITLSSKQEFNAWEGKPQFMKELTIKLNKIMKTACPTAKMHVF